MSVTFTCSDAPTTTHTCEWCEQARKDRMNSHQWPVLDGEVISDEAVIASWGDDEWNRVTCDRWCRGTREESTAPECNFSNMNAANVLRLLGLYNPEGPWGALTLEEIPAVLQRCMVVLASDQRRSHLVEDPSEEGGERRMVVNENGMPEIRTGCRIINCGNTDSDTVRRVTAIRDLLCFAVEHGYEVSWG